MYGYRRCHDTLLCMLIEQAIATTLLLQPVYVTSVCTVYRSLINDFRFTTLNVTQATKLHTSSGCGPLTNCQN